MKVASFFAGCGGLDLGFRQAGYEVVWANEFDEAIHKTYQFNHPNTFLCKSDIRTLKAADIPDCDGFIGGLLANHGVKAVNNWVWKTKEANCFLIIFG